MHGVFLSTGSQMRLRGSLPFILLLFLPFRVHAVPSDTLQVLRLLEQARKPSVTSLTGFLHDSAFSAQALELAERIGWQRGVFKGHLWSMLSISGRSYEVPAVEWEQHLQGALQLRAWASPQEVVMLYRLVGRNHVLHGEMGRASAYLDTAQWEAQRCGDTLSLALVAFWRAYMLRAQERWGEAFRAILTSNARSSEVNTPLLKSASFNLSGMIRGRLGDLDGAVKDFTMSLAIADSMKVNGLRSVNHTNWAYVMQVKGHWREALDHYRAVRELAISAGASKDELAECETGIGYMLVRLDSLDQAAAILDRLRSTKAMVGHPYEQEFNNAWAFLQLRRGRYREAAVSAHTAFVTEQGDENDVIKRDASRILSDAYKALGQPGEALKWTEVAHQWEDSVLYRQQANDAVRQEMEREMATRAEQDSLANAEKSELAEHVVQQRLSTEKTRRNWLVIAGSLAVLLALFLWRRLRHTGRAKRSVEKALDRSDTLLHNILPSEVAQELKDKGEAQARDVENVSILFTDFKGFTQMSEQLTAQELVAEINTCFKAFDGIIGKHGVEKIKTIGDAYMAAGGLPVPTEHSARNTVLAGLEMQAFMKSYTAERIAAGKPAFTMRVGIHTGPVVAGIVGVKKFAYDIWGDTVNTASRMESSGEVGQVNISESTYALVKDEPGLTFTPRGRVQAKGKGELEMYFVFPG